MSRTHQLDTFTRAYIECALWSSSDNSTPQGGEPLDANYDIDDIALESLEKMIGECQDFQNENSELLAQAGDDVQNGHDYWLTRNGHGAGFWDRGYPRIISEGLTKAAKADGSRDLYVGDDGLIYQA